jgi:hypothetical protein
VTERFLHPAVERELANPSPEGDRHNQILRVLPCLVGDGWDRDELFELLRSRYPADFPDAEIVELIDWGLSRDFEPSRAKSKEQNGQKKHYKLQSQPRQWVSLTPEKRARREKEKISAWIKNTCDWTAGFRVGEADVLERSPIRPLDDIAEDAQLLFRHLYGRGELVNICPDYTLRDGKAQPCGAGLTFAAIEWCHHLEIGSLPQSEAGAWIRINPVKGRRGSGRGGSFTDADIETYRYHLLESDQLPLDLQLTLFSRLRLPIALILDSGGRSYHAWVKSYARTEIGYRAETDFLFSRLARFGLDRSNRNPSRFSRLPGVMRSIGARNQTGLPGSPNQIPQRILFLNPQPQKGRAIF